MIKCYISVLCKRQKSAVRPLATKLAKIFDKKDMEIVKIMEPFGQYKAELVKLLKRIGALEEKK